MKKNYSFQFEVRCTRRQMGQIILAAAKQLAELGLKARCPDLDLDPPAAPVIRVRNLGKV